MKIYQCDCCKTNHNKNPNLASIDIYVSRCGGTGRNWKLDIPNISGEFCESCTKNLLKDFSEILKKHKKFFEDERKLQDEN